MQILILCGVLLCAMLGGLPGARAADAVVSASELGLSEGLESALAQRSQHRGRDSPFRSSRWLAAVPSLSFSYLGSDETAGSDETEVALRLPLKSPSRVRADARLKALEDALQAVREDYRRLYFSGLIREAWWSWRIAELGQQGALRKVAVLEDLVARQSTLAKAGALPAYSSLITRRELLAARAELAASGAELASWQARYRELTGLPAPVIGERTTAIAGAAVRREALLESDASWPAAHPALRLLELEWQRQQAVLSANTSAADSWQLGLTAKEVKAPGFSDQQLGLSVEVPLSFIQVAAASEHSDWGAGADTYWRARDALLEELRERRAGLEAERAGLAARIELLRETVAVDEAIAGHLSALAAGNEIESEVLLRRRLDILQSRLDLRLAKARLEENGALLRQVKGVSL